MDTEKRPQGRLKQRRGNSLAGHVTQHDEDRVAGKVQEVVEVAADLVGRDHLGAPPAAEQFARDRGEQPALDLGRDPELLVESDAAPLQVDELVTGRTEAQAQVGESGDGGGGHEVADPSELHSRRPEGRDDGRLDRRPDQQDEQARPQGEGQEPPGSHPS